MIGSNQPKFLCSTCWTTSVGIFYVVVGQSRLGTTCYLVWFCACFLYGHNTL